MTAADQSPDSRLPDDPARLHPSFHAQWRLTVNGLTGHFHVDTASEDEAIALGRKLRHGTWRVEWRPVGEWQPLGPARRIVTTEEVVDNPGNDTCQNEP